MRGKEIAILIACRGAGPTLGRLVIWTGVRRRVDLVI
jgi:hypothetical protein